MNTLLAGFVLLLVCVQTSAENTRTSEKKGSSIKSPNRAESSNEMPADQQVCLGQEYCTNVAANVGDKRTERSESTDALLRLESSRPEHAPYDIATPLLEGLPAEPMLSFFKRVKKSLPLDLYQSVRKFDKDGIYLYKRPVSGVDGSSILAHGGSVFHHVVVFVQETGEVTALDFGPDSGADMTNNILEPQPSRSVLNHENANLEEAHLPMLYINTPAHPLSSEIVKRAIALAEERQYHAISNNCIHFADFIVRVLTGGVSRNAPWAFDVMCGTVPQEDHPAFMLFAIMTQNTWHSACDGSSLTSTFLQHHTLPLPEGAVLPKKLPHTSPEPSPSPATGPWGASRDTNPEAAMAEALRSLLGGALGGNLGGMPQAQGSPAARSGSPKSGKSKQSGKGKGPAGGLNGGGVGLGVGLGLEREVQKEGLKTRVMGMAVADELKEN